MTYQFEDDVKFSERYENQLIDYINETTPFSARKTTEKGYPDIEVSEESGGKFYIEIFDEWVRNDVGQYYVQIFDATLANTVGEQPGSCIYAKKCGHASVMEFNGDVYACDHYVFPEYKLGNIKTKTIFEMMFSDEQLRFKNGKPR